MKYFLLSLLTYKGRHNRKQFIVSQLIAYTLLFLPVMLTGQEILQTHGPGLPPEEYQRVFFQQYSFTAIPPMVFAAYLLLVSYIKRLHDLDKPAWWAALIIIPYIRYAFILFLTIQKGSDQTNKYGPPPLQKIHHTGGKAVTNDYRN